MKSLHIQKVAFLAAFICASPSLLFAQVHDLLKPDQATQGKILQGYGSLPLSFEANQGQTDAQVKFLSRGAGYNLFLTSGEAVLVLRKTSAQKREFSTVNTSAQRANKSAVLHMQLLGSNSASSVSGFDEMSAKSNYFIGNDPKKWRTNVVNYMKVRYQGVYPGVDLVYYGNQRQLEYDFVVAPGADPSRIRLKFRGAGTLRIDDKGDLVLGDGKQVRLQKPQVYQEASGARKAIAGRYWLEGANTITFRVADYDRSKALVIDPVLVYSTYLGGSGTDYPFGIAVDSVGNAYVTGYTDSPNFPTVNAIQSSIDGNADAFVTKINASGTALVYSTYLGGSGGAEAFGIALDSIGNVYVTGYTGSANFPTINAVQSSFGGGDDAFVTKINASGTALLYSTYLGGSGTDIAYGIAVDSIGDAYITGLTNSPNFPTVNAIQSTFGGGGCGLPPFCDGTGYYDAFVAKINASGTALVFSTYLGGIFDDRGYSIAVDSADNVYVVGSTTSTNFPTVNAIQSVFSGGGTIDAFVTKINASGTALVYSTYLSGSSFGQTYPFGVAVDSVGNAYVTGSTSSSNFPTVNALQSTFGGGSVDAFVSKINGSGTALVYSTYLGGTGNETGHGMAVDSSGNAYVTGYTGSTNFPTLNAIQSSFGGGDADAFVTKINASGTALVYSTYLGGSSTETGLGIAVDSAGSAYVTGVTNSPNFPTVNAIQSTFGGGNLDGFVAKINGGVDNISPTTNATASPGPNGNGWNNTNVTVTLNATDNPGGSGVKQIQLALSGAQNSGLQTVAGNTAAVTISAEGTTILSYFATDNAGNQETAKTLTVRIDKTLPVISGLPAPGCSIWPPNHKLVQVATVTAADALSGLDPGSFKVTGTSNDPANGQIVITGGPSQFSVQLEADKDEVYTLTVTASDLAGNVASEQATCTVLHDQGK
jgi:hypothetical protein